jgi:hypothetical protein
VTAKALRLADLVRHVQGALPDGPVVDILLKRADRILAKDGGRDCKRVLTDAEVDLVLAGDEPVEEAAWTGPAPELSGEADPPSRSLAD